MTSLKYVTHDFRIRIVFNGDIADDDFDNGAQWIQILEKEKYCIWTIRN